MVRGQIARGAWTPSVGDVARLAWGVLLDATEMQRHARNRFLELQIDLAERRIAELAARREEDVDVPAVEPPLGVAAE
jgi:hypothetical protein